MAKITTLFLDIGGVLMTNGWDRYMRENAAQAFDLDLVDFEKRHRQFYDSYEQGLTTFDDYLNKTLFWTERNFSKEKFKNYVLGQSKPFPDMIAFFVQLKKDFGLRVAAISNEGRDLIEHRIKVANLKSFIDDFFISSFVGFQKPDRRIYHIALDVTQTLPRQSIFIDDRIENVNAAKELGIKGIHQTSLSATRKALFSYLNP